MSDANETVPQPELAELQQEETKLPAVDVRVVGPVQVQRAPNRLGVVDEVALVVGAAPERLLSADLRRARATLLSSVAFNIRRNRAGIVVAWPANVPLVLEHGDELFGQAAAADATVSVITEFYAD